MAEVAPAMMPPRAQGARLVGRTLRGPLLGTITYSMLDDDPAPDTRSRALVWLGGFAALAAWGAMLWFMFGDVL
jgi:hypothetical protein